MTEMHPQANYSLVSGVLSTFFPLLAPVVWWQTHHILRDMDAHPSGLAGRDRIVIGRAFAILGSVALLVTTVVTLSSLTFLSGPPSP